MQGLPSEAFDMLVQMLARICDDPYDPVFSTPVPPVPCRRVADLDDFGFIEFIADEAQGTSTRLPPGADWLEYRSAGSRSSVPVLSSLFTT